MKKYLNFIEKYSLEDKFYCKLTDIYKKGRWEVHWNPREHGAKQPWKIKYEADDHWTYCHKRELLDYIYKYKVDILQFEDELISKIKSMIVFSVMMHDEAKTLLGKDIVKTSLKEYEDFAESFVQALKKLLPDLKEESKQTLNSEHDNLKHLDFTQKAIKKNLISNQLESDQRIKLLETFKDKIDTDDKGSSKTKRPGLAPAPSKKNHLRVVKSK